MLEANGEADQLAHSVKAFNAMSAAEQQLRLKDDPWLGVIATQQKTLKQDPDNAKAMAKACEGMVGRQQYFIAHRTCSKAIKIRPKLALAHAMLGSSYMMMAADDQAAGSFREALSLNPKQAGVHYYVGWFYHQVAHQPEKALTYYRKATLQKDSTQYPDAWYWMAKIQQQRKQFTTALSTVNQGINRHNTYSDLYELKASLYRDLSLSTRQDEYFFKAVKAYKKAITMSPKKAYYHNDLGFLYWSHGQHNAAKTHYLKAVALDNKLASALSNLGVLEQDAGAYDSSITYFSSALQLDPDDKQSRYLLAESYYLTGQYESALNHMQRYLKHRPDHVNGWVGLGQIYEKKGATDKALMAFDKALSLDPTHKKATQLRQQLS
jgi:superkiller protein 3